MYPVSPRFLDALTGTHEAVSRARLFPRTLGTDDIGFGTSPTGGVELPILDGDVKLTRTGDIKATLDLTVPGDAWDWTMPGGGELFVERGIDFGDGTTEWVALGWYRIEDIDQDDAPDGPIKIAGNDRIAQIMQNRAIYPYQVPLGTTHETLFYRFVNGNEGAGPSTAGAAAYFYIEIPIEWTSYDPASAVVPDGTVAEDSLYDTLVALADNRNSVLRMSDGGTLLVEDVDGPLDPSVPVWRLRGGEGGTLLRASRKATRKGVYNIVSSYGSDTAFPTGYQYLSDDTSRVRQTGPFGPAARYFASPLLHSASDALGASAWWLTQYGGVPVSWTYDVVPNPALRPNDILDVEVAGELQRIEQITIPLAGSDASTITTTTTLAV